MFQTCLRLSLRKEVFLMSERKWLPKYSFWVIIHSLDITWLNLHLVLNFTRLLRLTSCYVFAWLQTRNLRCKQSLAKYLKFMVSRATKLGHICTNQCHLEWYSFYSNCNWGDSCSALPRGFFSAVFVFLIYIDKLCILVWQLDIL